MAIPVVLPPEHEAHHPTQEWYRGKSVEPFEQPGRLKAAEHALRASSFARFLRAEDFGMAPIRSVHDDDYLDFLKNAASRSLASGASDSLPYVWPARMATPRRPRSLVGAAGFYSADAATPISAEAWRAGYGAAQAALTAASALMNGGEIALALVRPPGHHAGPAQCMGYCYVNNSAVAAAWLKRERKERVAIIDLDFHHGNGTQAIFHVDPDVVFASIHGDPDACFPFFSGYADEVGEGAGVGATLNLPLRPQAGWTAYSEALDQALAFIAASGASVLVVSIGTDIAAGDPLGNFGLGDPHFHAIGDRLGTLCRPLLFVLEGGYDTRTIGPSLVALLAGAMSGRGLVKARGRHG